MRRINVAAGALFLSLFLCAGAFAAVSSLDETDILRTIGYLEDCVYAGDAQSVLTLLSPNARPALKKEVEAALAGNTVRFYQRIDTWNSLSPTKIRVEGSIRLEGHAETTKPGESSTFNWQMNDVRDFFVFDKINGQWFIADMDFHRMLNTGFAAHPLAMTGLLVAAFIFCGIFWIWMLVDCIVKPVENKIVWLLVIIFLNIIGATLYILLAHRNESV